MTNPKRIISCLLIVGMSVFGCTPFSEASSAEITATSIVLLRPDTKEIIFARGSHRKTAVASTTKVVTALVVIERLNLDEWVKIDSRVESAPPSKLGLREGDELLVRDLLKAILMKSANDAAQALAMWVAGSEQAFAELMNQKVRELGAKQSHFVNATGLPQTNHYSTAYDLAIIMSEACKSPVILSIMKQKNAVIHTRNGKEFFIKNHNKMLWRRSRVIGKTGWTRKARHCFIGLIQHHARDVVIVILGSSALWRDLSYLSKKMGSLIHRPKNEVLLYGARGEEVVQIQKALKRAGYFNANPTGYFGEQTQKAVLEFQRAHQLLADGAVGSETQKILSQL